MTSRLVVTSIIALKDHPEHEFLIAELPQRDFSNGHGVTYGWRGVVDKGSYKVGDAIQVSAPTKEVS